MTHVNEKIYVQYNHVNNSDKQPHTDPSPFSSSKNLSQCPCDNDGLGSFGLQARHVHYFLFIRGISEKSQ